MEDVEDEPATAWVRIVPVGGHREERLDVTAMGEGRHGELPLDVAVLVRHGSVDQLIHGCQDAEGTLQFREDRPVPGTDREAAERQLGHPVVPVVVDSLLAHGAELRCPATEDRSGSAPPLTNAPATAA
ncbi:hypothetical protein ACFCV9_13190 [Streptomyces sp. NPDC056367]|uniref:hypothetical protein n=1 Tax=Streptomyces sp. NPDC056367 TaxID=3345797 RepID=UPI0035DECF2F